MISESFAPDPMTSANPLQLWIPTFAAIWILGMVAMLVYTVVSYVRVKRRIGTAVRLRDNIYQSESVVSPFVLGIFTPKIYLPFNMNEQNTSHVIAHEQAHIRRRDHLNSMGVNYLLNVGPDGLGRIPSFSAEALRLGSSQNF